MAGAVEKKLNELGIVLTEPAAPVANYVPFVRTGNLLSVSGQICHEGGKLVAKGKLGADVSIEDGQKAARACAVNVLAHVKVALGDLDKVVRVVRLSGFVNSTPDFVEGSESHEWRVRPYGRGVWRQGQAFALDHRRRGLTAERGDGSRGAVRSVLTLANTIDWLTARPIAHRGLHDAASGLIENTAGAVRAAIANDYGIEVDLQISADGEAMVHHDAVLGRVTDGEGRLDALTAAELKRVAFRGTDEHMMTLGDLCDLVGGRVTMLLELKSRFDGDPLLSGPGCGGSCRISRTGRADVVRSACSSTCCGKRPLACCAALLRQNTGLIPIGIRCGHGCAMAWAPCCRP